MSGAPTPGSSRRSSRRTSAAASRRGSQQSVGSVSSKSVELDEDVIQQLADDNVVNPDDESEVRVVQAEVHTPSIPNTPELPRRSARLKSKKNPTEGSSVPTSREPTPDPPPNSKRRSSKDSTTPKSALKKPSRASSSKASTAPKDKPKAPLKSPKVPLEIAYPQFSELRNTPLWPLCEVLVGTLQSLQYEAHNATPKEKEEFLAEHLNTEKILSCAQELQKAYAPQEDIIRKTEERIASRLVSDLLMKTQTLKEDIHFPFTNYWIPAVVEKGKIIKDGFWDDEERKRSPKEDFEPYSKTMRTRFQNLQLETTDDNFREFFEKLIEIDENLKLSPRQVCIIVDLCFSDQASRIFKHLKRTYTKEYEKTPKQDSHPVNLALKEIYSMLPYQTVLRIRLTDDFFSAELTARMLAPDICNQTLTRIHALARDAFPGVPDAELCSMIKLKFIMTLPKEMRLLLLTQEERRKSLNLGDDSVENLFGHIRFWSGRTNRSFRGYNPANLNEVHLYNDAEFGCFQIFCRERKIPFSIPQDATPVVIDGQLSHPPEVACAPPVASTNHNEEWKDEIQKILIQNQQMSQAQGNLLQQQAQLLQTMMQTRVYPTQETVYHVPQLAITDQSSTQPLPSLSQEEAASVTGGGKGSKSSKKSKKGKKKEAEPSNPDQMQANAISEVETVLHVRKSQIYKTPPRNAESKLISMNSKNFDLHQKQVYDLYKDIPFTQFIEENLRIQKIDPWWRNHSGIRKRDRYNRFQSDSPGIDKSMPIFYKKGNQYFLARALINFFKERDLSFCCASKSCRQDDCEVGKSSVLYCASCMTSFHPASTCSVAPLTEASPKNSS